MTLGDVEIENEGYLSGCESPLRPFLGFSLLIILDEESAQCSLISREAQSLEVTICASMTSSFFLFEDETEGWTKDVSNGSVIVSGSIAHRRQVIDPDMFTAFDRRM